MLEPNRTKNSLKIECSYIWNYFLRRRFLTRRRPRVLTTELKVMEQQYATSRITKYELMLLCTYIPGWPKCRLKKQISEKFARSNFELLNTILAVATAVSNINLLEVTFTRNAFQTAFWSPWYRPGKQNHVNWLTRSDVTNQRRAHCTIVLYEHNTVNS